jgi:hypothetical protein
MDGEPLLMRYRLMLASVKNQLNDKWLRWRKFKLAGENPLLLKGCRKEAKWKSKRNLERREILERDIGGDRRKQILCGSRPSLLNFLVLHPRCSTN